MRNEAFPLTRPKQPAKRRSGGPSLNKPASRPARASAEADEAAHKIEEMTSSPTSVNTSAGGLVGGLAIGATVGSVAGPPGAIVGAIVGSVIGAGAGLVWGEMQDGEELKDERLDREIGVTDGNLGSARPNQPKARIGAFSAASMGAGGGDSGETADGPMPSAEGEDD